MPHHIPDEAIALCSTGITSHYSLTFKKLASDLERLNTAQEILTIDVKTESERLREAAGGHGLSGMVETTARYQQKLAKLQGDMSALTERSAKLRKRAARLQDEKQKEALRRENKRVMDLERENELIAKPAKK